MTEEGLIHCDGCGEDWTPSAYAATGTAYHGRSKRLCGACFTERYPRVFADCAECGRQIVTRGAAERHTCRPCRRALKAGRRPKPSRCKECGVSATGIRMTGDYCRPCYRRAAQATEERRAA